MSEELKPCPFCGSSAESRGEYARCANLSCAGWHWVEIAAWNTRPAPVVQVPEGWRLVPVEPTGAMLCAGESAMSPRAAWPLMLAAAPAHAPSAAAVQVPEVKRYTVTGDYAYPVVESADGEFVQYDDYAAMLAPAQSRCPLCGYQHGHQIGCENNPVDIALLAAAPAPATVARCDTCDGTGDVHDATGEWRGRCQHCAPATVATEAVAQGGGVDAEKLEDALRSALALLSEKGNEAQVARIVARALLASPAASGWIPVSERLPVDRRTVLVYCSGAEFAGVAWLGENGWNIPEPQAIGYESITHWQPLPAAPAIANQGEGEE